MPNNTVLYENSMFTTPAERATLVQDGKLCTELFFINYLGFLGLYALNDSRGYMKTYEQTEKHLKINEIADDNHDASLIVKLCVDAGVLPEAKTLQVTKFLALIKQRTVRSKDVDSVRVRALIEQTLLHVKPMGPLVKPVVTAFMDGTVDIKEFARQIYDASKNNAYRPYTNEFRTLVLKGQYTDYFTVMKRGGTVAPPANQAAGVPANVKPAAIAPQTGAPTPAPVRTAPNLPKVPTDAEFDAFVKKAFEMAGGKSVQVYQALDAYVLSHPIRSSIMVDGVKAAIKRLPDTVFTGKWDQSSGSTQWAAVVELRLIDALSTVGKWDTAYWSSLSTADIRAMNNQHDPGIVAEIREQVRRAVVAFGIPTASRIDDWIKLSALAREVLTPTERDTHFASMIAEKSATAHNMHIKTLLVNRLPGTPWLYSADALDPKAATWIRNFGQKVGGTDVIVSSAMTTPMWNTISIDDKMLWQADNWTVEGALKGDRLWSKALRMPSITQTTQAARDKMVDILGASAYDPAHVEQMYAVMTSPDFLIEMSALAAMRAMIATKKPVRIPSAVVGKMKIAVDTDASATTEAIQLTRMLRAIDVSTPAGTNEFMDFMKAMAGDSGGRVGALPASMPVDIKAPLKSSNIQWLPWVGLYRVDVPGVREGHASRTLVVSREACHPEVAAWIEQYGSAANTKIIFSATFTSVQDLADEMFMAFTDKDESAKNKGYIVPDDIFDQIKALKSDWWYESAKRIWEKKRTPTTFRTVSSSLYSFMNGRRLEWAQFSEMTEAYYKFFMNEVPSADLKDVDVSTLQIGHLVPPLTTDKMIKAERAAASEYRYNSSSFDEYHANALFHAGITQKIFAPGFAPLATMMLAQVARATDTDRYAQSCVMAMNEGFDPVRPIIIAAVNSGEVLTPDEFAPYRWAWGVDGDKVTAMIEEANANHAERAAAGTYDLQWTPFKLTPGQYVSREKFDEEFLKTVTATVQSRRFGDAGAPVLITAPWLDEINLDVVKPAPKDPNGAFNLYAVENGLKGLGGVTKGDEIARKFIIDAYDIIGKSDKAKSSIFGNTIASLIKMSRLHGVDADVIKGGVKNTFEAYAKRGAKPLDYAELAGYLGEEGGDYVSTEDMGMIVKKLASSTSAACLAAITDLAYTSTSNGQVSKTFIEAVRAANVERAMINRLGKTSIMSQAVTRINGDPKGVKVDVKPERMNDFLKYNDVDVTVIGSTMVSRLEDFGSVNDKLNAIIPDLYLEEDTTPGVLVQKARDLHRSNRYNHSPALGLEVKRSFKVTLPGQQERFDRWLAANGQTKIMTLFHGTGTYAAQFLLRYGFRIIKATDGSVTGRMLGDGIYFADNINKSMLYMSNAGYIRQAGQEGYVFKCKVALGKRPRDHREGNAERSGLVSNEWSIMSIDQIVIEEAYYGVSQRRDDIRRMLNEAADQYSPNVSSFMFMDGMIPITPDLLVDFAKLPDFGAHVSIETSAKGPIVNIRHDSTVEPVDRCYRWGEQLTAASKKKELKQFLDLLQNRY